MFDVRVPGYRRPTRSGPQAAATDKASQTSGQATTNRFAPVLRNGKRKDDGLQRSQFGGTAGGPILRNTLFFFAGYQGTNLHQQANANVAFVPTAARLAARRTRRRRRGIRRRSAKSPT